MLWWSWFKERWIDLYMGSKNLKYFVCINLASNSQKCCLCQNVFKFLSLINSLLFATPTPQIKNAPPPRWSSPLTTRPLWRAWPTSAATCAESTSPPSTRRDPGVLSQQLWWTAGWTLSARHCREGLQRRRCPFCASSIRSWAPPSSWWGQSRHLQTSWRSVQFVSRRG